LLHEKAGKVDAVDKPACFDLCVSMGSEAEQPEPVFYVVQHPIFLSVDDIVLLWDLKILVPDGPFIIIEAVAVDL
jgi:hypothetical protein